MLAVQQLKNDKKLILVGTDWDFTCGEFKHKTKQVRLEATSENPSEMIYSFGDISDNRILVGVSECNRLDIVRAVYGGEFGGLSIASLR